MTFTGSVGDVRQPAKDSGATGSTSADKGEAVYLVLIATGSEERDL